MAYSIRNFANTTIYSVNDSTANTNAVSITLLGKSLANYGTYFNQNFVWLMENFSSDSANPPPYAVQGQLWWDNTYKFLNVYDGSNWKTVYGNLATLNVNGAVIASSLTATNITGTITTNAQPYITSFGTLSSLSVAGNINANQVQAATIGNSGATFSGASGTLTGTLSANIFTANSIYAGTIGNTGTSLVGTISTAAQTNITSIGNLTTSLGVGGVYHDWGTRVLSVNGSIPAVTLGTGGTTVNAYMYYANTQKLIIGTRGIVAGSAIEIQPALTGAANGTTTFSFTTSSDLVATNNGQFKGYFTGAIGANTANTGAFTTITSTSHVTPTANNTANIGALSTLYANVLATNYYVANSFIPIANVTADLGSAQRYFEAAYVVDHTVANSIIPTANVTANIGSVNKWYNSIYGSSFYGTSTTAQYADLAEKYTLDQDYPIGTVVMIGGDAEATQHDGRSVRALGSVSANPAYKMNDGLKNGTYIALKGRVPVRVIGPVLKGQSLRGGPSGLAIAEEHSSAYTFAIAMETVSDIVETTIEAVIL